MEKEKNRQNCSVVIPAYNEQRTVKKVVKTALNTPGVTEVIVVNDGSTDQTRKKIEDLPVKIIDHKKNMGYTKAMHDGIVAANGPVVAIIDADWKNITTESIKKIIDPVIEDRADLVKAAFNLSRGRVTEFAVKPMMKILFPEFQMAQPISGQFAGYKSFLQNVKVETSWGIAIGILIDAIDAGLRVMEVDIGKLEHKARTTEEKAQMAQEVLETMVKRTGLIRNKYKLIVFTLDEALISLGSYTRALEKLGLRKSYIKAMEESSNPLKNLEKIASPLKERTVGEIENALKKIRVPSDSKITVENLHKRRFDTALITTNLSPIADVIAEKTGINQVESVKLEVKNGKYTGKLQKISKKLWANKAPEQALTEAIVRLARRRRIKMKQIVLVTSSTRTFELFEKVGLTVAYRPTNKELKLMADKTIKILPELLIIVE